MPKPTRRQLEELAVCSLITVIAAVGWVLILAPMSPPVWLILVTGGLVVIAALYLSKAWTWWHTRNTVRQPAKEARR
ncbi:hypothetical protein [Streptomyces olivaceiscleroticus]|uniref:Uncharacterized protein n=1 Tax=Streptomyces olivaceiscleroticus TaxID=68245 RepID=A0ABN1BP89_9ACTN